MDKAILIVYPYDSKMTNGKLKLIICYYPCYISMDQCTVTDSTLLE